MGGMGTRTIMLVLLGLCAAAWGSQMDECEMYYDCVRCHFYDSGPLSPKECEECRKHIHFEIIETVDPLNNGSVCIELNADGQIESYYLQDFDEEGKRVIQSLATEQVLDSETTTYDTFENTRYNRRRGDSLPEMASYPPEVTPTEKGDSEVQKGQVAAAGSRSAAPSVQLTGRAGMEFVLFTVAIFVAKLL